MRSIVAAAYALTFLAGTAAHQAVAQFKFDLEGLEKRPPAAMPRAKLTLRSFEADNILRTLAGSEERVERKERIAGTREAHFSGSWRVERQVSEGAVLVANLKPVVGGREEIDPKAAESQTLERLGKFGIPRDEIGATAVRKLVTREMEAEGKESASAEFQRMKTFVRREINGVPVEGHRAVVSFLPSGEMVRASVLWPALAARGHSTTTRLPNERITALVTQALKREGEREGAVQLKWKYVPVKQANGEVVLRLVVAARIKPVVKGGTELREINVSLPQG